MLPHSASTSEETEENQLHPEEHELCLEEHQLCSEDQQPIGDLERSDPTLNKKPVSGMNWNNKLDPCLTGRYNFQAVLNSG